MHYLTRGRAIALVVCIFTVLAALHTIYFAKDFPDEHDYWKMAENMVNEGILSLDGKTSTAYRPPLAGC